MEAREVLEKVKNNEISIEEAEKYFKKRAVRGDGICETGYAPRNPERICGGIFCARKADEHLLKIFTRLYEQDGEVFGTRASEHQYELIREKFPEVVYDPLSHILKIEKKDKKRIGKIAVCTAGTADISVAEEAAQTAEYFGANVERIYDVGVSGIHRLLSRLDTIQSANCVVAVAGMEGAAGERARRLGGQAGDCCSDIRWLRGQHERSFGAAYDDQFLRERNCRREYRQRLWSRIYCNTD